MSSSCVPSSIDASVLEHADPVGMAHGREAMRDENRRTAADRAELGQHAIENLRLAPHVELRGRFVEQDDAGAEADRAQRARQRNTLPLAAGEVGAAVVAAGSTACSRSARSAAPADSSAARIASSGAPAGATLSRSGNSNRMKSWNTAVSAMPPIVERERADVHAVDLDRAGLRVVQATEQLGEGRLASTVLPDDRHRRPCRDRQVESIAEQGRHPDS